MTTQTTYPFTTPSNYTYDTDDIEVTGGKASLKATPSAQTDNEDYETPGNYAVSDAAKIEVTGGSAQLKTVDLPGQDFNEDFADDTDFTYNSDEAEFSGGQVQQKDQRPTGYQIFDDFSDGSDANWGVGTLTRTLTDGATISGGELDCTGGTPKKCQYNTDNFDIGGEIKIDIKFRPDFTGDAPETFYFLEQATTPYIRIFAAPGGWSVRIHDGVSSYAINRYVGKTDWVANQQYHMELFVKSGDSRCYLDGNLEWQDTGTFTKTVNSTSVYLGNSSGSAYNSHLKIDDCYIGTDIGSYALSETYSPTIYTATEVILPEMEHTGVGVLRAIESFVTSESGTPRYTIQVGQSGDYLYWNGVDAWDVSDGSYSQATDASTFNTQAPNLDIDGELYGQLQVHFTGSNTQSNVADLTITVTAEEYSQDDPYVTPISSLDESAIEAGVDSWDSFTPSETKAGSDEIKYILSFDDGTSWYYWSVDDWVVSNETYAQANTGTEVDTNIDDATNPFPTTNSTLMIRAFLHSDDGTTRPTLQNIQVGWTTVGALVTTNPTVVPNSGFRTDLLTSLAETSTKPNNAEIKYILSKDGVDYYHDGSNWVVSDGSYSQSNTAAEINLVVVDFTSQDVAGVDVEVTIFLHTDTDVDNPELDTLVVSYDFSGDAEDSISTCSVYGYVNNPEQTALTNAITIDLVPNVALYKDNVVIESETITVTPNDDGYFEVNLIENENMAGVAYYRFKIDGRYLNLIVPDATSKSLHELAPLR